MYLGITEKIVMTVFVCIAVFGSLYVYGLYKYTKGYKDMEAVHEGEITRYEARYQALDIYWRNLLNEERKKCSIQ